MSIRLQEVTSDNELQEHIEKCDKLVVDYYSKQCVNCQLIEYYLHHFSKDYNH